MKKDVGSARCIESIKELLERFRPDVLVLEAAGTRESKRSLRVKRIRSAVAPFARKLGTEIAVVSYRNVRAAFAPHGALNKQDIAEVIARKLDAFAPRIPKARGIWQAEDPRMALFDAASRALTYYYRLEAVANQ